MHVVYRVVTAFKLTIRTKASILSILPYEISNSRFVTVEALSREKFPVEALSREKISSVTFEILKNFFGNILRF